MAKEISYKHELVGVFGYPVAENPTGVMQEAAFNALGLPWRYLSIEIMPNELQSAIQGLRVFKMQGVNLTIPHKVEVLKYLDEVSSEAALMGAVNTVRRVGDKLYGENTDGKGFIRSLKQDAKIDPRGKRALIFGAGGAARAITVELALAGAKAITIINRTRSRAQELAYLLNEKTSVLADYFVWDSCYSIPYDYDIVVNATSIGLYPQIDQKLNIDYHTILPSMIVCDVIPNPPRTHFLKEAEKRSAHTLNGLGMLVYQGAIAFKLWTGVDAPVDVMREALSKIFDV